MPYVLRLEDDSKKTLTRKLRDLQGAERDADKDAAGAEHPPAEVKPGAISDPYGNGSWKVKFTAGRTVA
jgi:hypothetical protein